MVQTLPLCVRHECTPWMAVMVIMVIMVIVVIVVIMVIMVIMVIVVIVVIVVIMVIVVIVTVEVVRHALVFKIDFILVYYEVTVVLRRWTFYCNWRTTRFY